MAGFLKDIALGAVREEMKKRVDEVINAGNEWNKTANELIGALDRLTEAIQKGYSVDLKPINKELRKLAKQTKSLSRAFNTHRKTLVEIIGKL